jgi:hypothetical protein
VSFLIDDVISITYRSYRYTKLEKFSKIKGKEPPWYESLIWLRPAHP